MIYFNHCWIDERIRTRDNTIVRREFKPASFESAAHYLSHYAADIRPYVIGGARGVMVIVSGYEAFHSHRILQREANQSEGYL